MVQLTRPYTFVAALLVASTAVAYPLNNNNIAKRQESASATDSVIPTDDPTGVPSGSLTVVQSSGSASFPAPSGSGFPGGGLCNGTSEANGTFAASASLPSGSGISGIPQPSGGAGPCGPGPNFNGSFVPSGIPSGSGFSDFPAPTGSFSGTPSGAPTDLPVSDEPDNSFSTASASATA